MLSYANFRLILTLALFRGRDWIVQPEGEEGSGGAENGSDRDSPIRIKERFWKRTGAEASP